VAGDRGGGPVDADPLHENTEEPARPEEAGGATAGGGEEAEGGGEAQGEDDAAQRIRVRITARRVRIDPVEKREQYINKVEKLMEELDQIIAKPNGVETIQLKAMNLLIRAIRLCYGIVSDVEVEMLEEEVEELKKTEAEVKGKPRVGYVVRKKAGDT